MKRDEWLEARKSLVGASEIAALAGEDPFGDTPLDVYRRKVDLEAYDDDSPDMQRGRALEPIIAGLYEQETGHTLLPARLYVHPDEPRMGATPDRIIPSGDLDLKQDTTVEIKSVRLEKFTQIKEYGLPPGWIIQKQAQLEVCDIERGIFIFHNADTWQKVYFPIERNRQIGRACVALVREFWPHVERREPPKPTKVDLPDIPTMGGEVIVRDDPAFMAITTDLRGVLALRNTADRLYDVARKRLMELLEAFGMYEGGGVRVHYKPREGKISRDWKALKRNRPLDRNDVALMLGSILQPILSGPEAIRKVEEWLCNCELDLSQFETRKQSYVEVRTYAVKSPAPRKRDLRVEDAEQPVGQLRSGEAE